jgi:hypothetical protein
MSRVGSRELRLVLLLFVVLELCEIRPASAAGGPPAPAMRDLGALERAIDDIGRRVVTADFQGAISRAEAARSWAGDVPRSPDALQARAELEVLLCTAQVALGDRSGAQRSMQRALYVWPLLVLDDRTTSPRVLDVFRAVHGARAAGRAP